MWRDEAYLLDILNVARHTMEFCENLTREQFDGSKLHHYAVMRTLGVIGEAARKVSPQFQQFPSGDSLERDDQHEEPARP